MNFENKNVLVCGIARSGISAALLLANEKANVTLQDLKPIDKIDEDTVNLLKNNNISLYLGKNPDDIISKQDLIIISPGIPLTLPFVKLANELKVKVIGEVELAYYFTKSPIIAITGTNGKTTTTALTGEILKSEYKNTKIVGNIGIPFSNEAKSTTEDGFVVLEASSFQLDTIESFHPKIAAVLNITPDHLDRHGNMENYILAKENIFLNQNKTDFLILNYEDETCRKMALKSKSKIIYFNGLENSNDTIYLKNNSIFANIFDYNNEFIINVNDLKLLGKHNFENVMASIAISICAKVPKEKIISTLKSFLSVPHRIEFCGTVNEIDFYNDSKATNPDSAIKSLEAMKKPILLIAGGYEKNSDFSDWVKLFNNNVKFVTLIGDVSDRLAKTLDENNFSDYSKEKSFEDAFNKCFSVAKTGDCILLSPACASWGMFKDFEERGNVFKELVKQKLDS